MAWSRKSLEKRIFEPLDLHAQTVRGMSGITVKDPWGSVVGSASSWRGLGEQADTIWATAQKLKAEREKLSAGRTVRS